MTTYRPLCDHPCSARVLDSGGWSCSRCEQFCDPPCSTCAPAKDPPLNGSVAILRAKVASLSVHIHVHERHAGDWSDCRDLECSGARSALAQTKDDDEDDNE